jgi:hypothetical protein
MKSRRTIAIMLMIMLLAVSTSALAACDVYKGGTKVLPQVTPTKTIDMDPSDGTLMYVYGAYQIGSTTQALTQLNSSGAYPNPAISYTFNTVGTVEFDAAVAYAGLTWDPVAEDWTMTSSGVDQYVLKTYTVCALPQPSASRIAQILTAIKAAIKAIFASWNL